jgi:hypothetical protein
MKVDAELSEGAAELGGLTLAGELFFEGPVGIVADEDSAAIAVESQGDAAAAEQAVEQVEIAGGSFGGEELSGEDFAGGVVLQAESGEEGAAAFEPIVRASSGSGAPSAQPPGANRGGGTARRPQAGKKSLLWKVRQTHRTSTLHFVLAPTHRQPRQRRAVGRP